MSVRKKTFDPTLDNILSLMGQKLSDYKGESRRSYQKAFSSFQVYVISNYSLSQLFDKVIVANWGIHNLIQGLSYKTVTFYIEKLSSLYTRISPKLKDGRNPLFKEVKIALKNLSIEDFDSGFINANAAKVLTMVSGKETTKLTLPDVLLNFPDSRPHELSSELKEMWACVALKAGVRPDHIPGFLGNSPGSLSFLQIFPASEPSDEIKKEIKRKLGVFLRGEAPAWFAMRLRPKVKFETLLQRFSQFRQDEPIPELFYPYQDITRKIGRKLIWEGRPAIRDVVFFKLRKTEIYSLFSRIYDLAWCYRTPGAKPGNYASIPEYAMTEFKKALGMLSPDFDVMPAGRMPLKPGDKVVILKGEYESQLAEVLKKSNESDNSHTVYRVSLLNSNGRWDIGIDARLLKKT